MAKSVSIDEFATELRRGAAPGEEYMTIKQMAKKKGVGLNWVRLRLQEAADAGRLVHKKVPKKSITGQACYENVYLILASKKRSK